MSDKYYMKNITQKDASVKSKSRVMIDICVVLEHDVDGNFKDDPCIIARMPSWWYDAEKVVVLQGWNEKRLRQYGDEFDALTEEQFDIAFNLAKDWHGTVDELLMTARRL